MSQAGYAVRPLLLIRSVHGPQTPHPRLPTAVLRRAGDGRGVGRGRIAATNKGAVPAPTQHPQGGPGLAARQPRLPASVTAFLERRGTSDYLRFPGIAGVDPNRSPDGGAGQPAPGHQRNTPGRDRSPRPNHAGSPADGHHRGDSLGRACHEHTGKRPHRGETTGAKARKT